ncbi:MAG: hypothetical protein A2514_11285 [Gammaproteobacteria bacterium RIFOXYD12_FULL_61_37]|nr:MAG: hypothetical protein A2514_11285 [Gammaproteobacteria bacterium RIFOXYD12_FULL_61_37]
MLQIDDLSSFISALAGASFILSKAYGIIINAKIRMIKARNSTASATDLTDSTKSGSDSCFADLRPWLSWLFLLLSLATLALLQFGPGGGKALTTGDMATITVAAMLFFQSHQVMKS